MDDRFSVPIAAFDTSSYAALEVALAPGPPTADELAGFVVLLEVGDRTAQIAVSWLLSRCVARGYPLLPNERRRVVAVMADDGRAWAVRYHLCLAVPHLRTPPDVATSVADTLDQLADDPDRQMRIAVLNAFQGLATRFAPLADRARAATERALTDKAPSVRAEARLVQRRGAGA